MKQQVPITRRDLLLRGLTLTAGGALALHAPGAEAKENANGFTFLVYSDVHVQPELHATEGYHKAIDTMKRAAPDAQFAICGGDTVFDALAVPYDRAGHLYDLYGEQTKRLGLTVYPTLGNHDIFGLDSAKSGASLDDPHFGKRLFLERNGLKQAYYSFDRNGWHFIVLDSVQATPERKWRGFVDDAQLAWLKADLEAHSRRSPTILVTHMPIISAIAMYTDGTTTAPTDTLMVANGKAIKELIQPYQVKAVLQGHTHIVEEIDYLGTKYVTAGAVSGNWWKGWRLGVHPEGFLVCRAAPNGDLSYKYVPYGWVAEAAA